MKKYAADNLMFLREEYPQIYRLIRNRDYNHETYVPDLAKNGEPIVSFREDESETPRWMYSRYNPSVEADRWAASIESKVRDVKDVLLYGFGFGYHAEAFLNLYPDKRLFIYEPRIDLFLCAVESRDLRPVLENRQLAMLALGDDFHTQLALLDETLNFISGRMVSLTVPVYQLWFPDQVLEFQRTIANSAATVATSLRTLKRFRNDWARNKILNMEKNLQTPSIKGLKDTCIGIPAIIVGSGPSLDMEIETLRELRSRALILAAGSSAQALQTHGIEPHMIVSMDPGPMNKRVNENLAVENIPFLYIPTVHHDVLNRPCKYRMHAFFNLDTPTAYLMMAGKGDPIFESTGTVTGTVLQAALFLGCREIYLIGQDFSFPDQRYYAAGVNHASDKKLADMVAASSQWVENVQGGQNRTDHGLNVQRRGIEQILSLYSHLCKYYNASQIGAKIEHTESKTLAQLLQERLDVRFEDGWFIRKCEQHLKLYPSERLSAIRNRLNEVYEKLSQFDSRMETIRGMLTGVQECQDFKKWLQDFESEWASLIDDDAFKHIHGFFLQRELNHLTRNWSEMLQLSDYRQRALKLVELMEPLLESWPEVSELLNKHFSMLNEKVNFTLDQSECEA